MSTYRISIGENEYLIEITESGIKINGELTDVDLRQLNEAGLYVLNQGEDKLEIHLRFEGNNSYLVMADGKQVLAQIEPDRDQPRAASATTESGDLRAPMPGLVVSVNVTEGDHVQDGDVLCVLESMKMQMAIHAPHAGVVKSVSIVPQQRVEKDASLIQIEKES